MARANRKTKATVREELESSPYLFEFHQAVKLLEMLNPLASPFGETVDASQEAVNVSSRITFGTLTSDIYSLTLPKVPGAPSAVDVNFMGIAGVQGPLPMAYSEIIYQRVRARDRSLKDFLDIFNHRLISILHQTRKQYMLGLHVVSPEKTPQAKALRSFLGIENRFLRDRMGVPDRSLLNYAALLWQRPRSRQGLEQLLTSYYGLPLWIEENLGCWRTIHPGDRMCLGDRNCRLGALSVIGDRVWDQEGRFCIHLGPLRLEEMDSFLPEGSNFKGFVDLVRFYVDPALDFEINYMIRERDVPPTTMDRFARLGWRSWLHSSHKKKGRPSKKDTLVDHQVRLIVP